MPELIIKVFFVLWILLMVPWQIYSIRQRDNILGHFNRIGILPIYTFFSPNPGKSDSHILYRDYFGNEDGSGNKLMTEWQEIITVNKKQFYNCIWNPRKRINKFVIDTLAELRTLNNFCIKAKMNQEDFYIFLETSRGYIALLNFVSGFENLSPSSMGRQFMVIDVSHDKEGRHVFPVFTSSIHRL